MPRKDWSGARIVDVRFSLQPSFRKVDDGQYPALAIELWEDIAKDLNLQSNYRFL